MIDFTREKDRNLTSEVSRLQLALKKFYNKGDAVAKVIRERKEIQGEMDRLRYEIEENVEEIQLGA